MNEINNTLEQWDIPFTFNVEKALLDIDVSNCKVCGMSTASETMLSFKVIGIRYELLTEP